MKKKLQIILGILLLFVSFGAIPAGLLLILYPDGSGLGMTTEYLVGSIFSDYFIPGLFLFTVNGVLNLIAGLLSFFKFKYTDYFGFIFGGILVLWIIIQVYTIGLTSFLQPFMFIIGIIEVILSYFLLKKQKNGAI